MSPVRGFEDFAFEEAERLVQAAAVEHATALSLASPRLTKLPDLSGCTNLRHLDLSQCRHLTDLSALTGLSALQSINISGCGQLTDLSALTALPRGYTGICEGDFATVVGQVEQRLASLRAT